MTENDSVRNAEVLIVFVILGIKILEKKVLFLDSTYRLRDRMSVPRLWNLILELNFRTWNRLLR